VAYPITRLRQIAPGGVPEYVHGLEEVIIRSLSEYGLHTWREAGHPGVWTPQGKIAAVGVALHRGVTLHGVAVNLQPDLSHFTYINPCGLGAMGVTSLGRLIGRTTDLTTYAEAFARHFGAVFARQVELVEGWPLARPATALELGA
jgi:lipoate-protein ligase B